MENIFSNGQSSITSFDAGGSNHNTHSYILLQGARFKLFTKSNFFILFSCKQKFSDSECWLLARDYHSVNSGLLYIVTHVCTEGPLVLLVFIQHYFNSSTWKLTKPPLWIIHCTRTPYGHSSTKHYSSLHFINNRIICYAYFKYDMNRRSQVPLW